ncbi:MAG: hypothetical protein HOO91_10935 [Bacteroidales bacterium]|nr:hypothetical protein [Bacteroidales bacterium]
MATTHTYKAFGLTIQSEIELPELSLFIGKADINISLGTTPKTLENPLFTGVRFLTKHNEFLLKVDRIANYYVTGGNQITIELMPDVDFADVRLFLLGSAFGALIHQRGLLPFHGSSVNINNSGVIFSGHSGAGKSTIAAALSKKGYSILSDDVSVISLINNEIPFIVPGYPQMKLWADSISKLGDESSQYVIIRKQVEKYNIPIDKCFHEEPLPLKNIFIIVPSNLGELKVESLKGVEKFNLLKYHTYRFNFIAGQEMQANHFKYLTTISKHVNVLRLIRPSKKFMFDEMINLILENIK